jgi:hypothetical protein
LAIEFECDRHRGAFRLARGLRGLLAAARGADDARMVEDRAMEPGGLFGLVVEPEEPGDAPTLACMGFSFAAGVSLAGADRADAQRSRRTGMRPTDTISERA